MTANKHISIERRWAIVTRWNEERDLHTVAAQLRERPRVVSRWVKRYLETGTVDDATKSGRPPTMSASATQQAYDLLFHEQVGGAKVAAQELHAAGLTPRVVHKTTVARAVRRLAGEKGERVTIMRGKPRKKLSEKTIQKRLAFCKSNLSRCWDNVMFTDRKKFHFSYPGVKVQPVTWCLGSGIREAPSVNHALVVNAYAGITRYGVTLFHLVAGTSKHQSTYKNKQGKGARNITSAEYGGVVKNTLLPEGKRIFSNQGIGTWVLQQDNDPTHKAAIPVVDEWNAQHASSVSILENWPPSSPDLSPIENFWGDLQRRMDAKGCSTFTEFKDTLIQEALATHPTVFTKLVGSMKRRLAGCIKNGGGKTSY
jgi:transposase